MPARLRPMFATLFACLALDGLIIALVFLVPRLAQAATINVPAGTSLQAAINSAGAGDTLRVQAGTFTESLMITKSLTLLGGWDGSFTTRVPRTTVISATGPGIDINGSGIQATVDGFEIRRSQGGIRTSVSLDSRLTITDNLLFANAAFGGISAEVSLLSAITIANNSIVSNTNPGPGSGGIGLQVAQRSHAIVGGNTMSRNMAFDGGGIVASALVSSQILIADNLVMTNTGLSGSGGVQLQVQNSSGRIERNQIISNTGGETGGISLLSLNSIVAVVDTALSRNIGKNTDGGLSVQAFDGAFSLQNLTLEGNVGDASGGGSLQVIGTAFEMTGTNRVTSNTGGSGFGTSAGGLTVLLASVPVVTLNGLQIMSNTITTTTPLACGGALIVGFIEVHAVLSGTQVISNTGDSGGLCLFTSAGSAIDVINSTIMRNTGLGSSGSGGIQIGAVPFGPTPLSGRYTISNTDVMSNSGAIGGGIGTGSFFSPVGGGEVIVAGSRIEANHAITGGGLAALGVSGTTYRVEENRIARNRAPLSAGCTFGSGPSGLGATIAIRRNVIEQNVGGRDSGCSFRGLQFGNVVVDDNLITDNQAADQYAGLTFDSALQSSVTARNNRIISNVVGISGTVPVGGSFAGLSILQQGGSAEIAGNQILSNSAVSSTSGGVGFGAGLTYLGMSSEAAVHDNLIAGNQAGDSVSGAAIGLSGGLLDVSRNTIRGNSAMTASAGLNIRTLSTLATLRQNTIGNNSSPEFPSLGVQGAGPTDLVRSENNVIFGSSGPAVTLLDSSLRSWNDTIANNAGPGIYMTGTLTTTASLSNTILFGNSTAYTRTSSAFTMTAGFSDIQGGWPGAGNLNVNPLFVSPTDFRLQAGSPLIGVGSNAFAPAVDHDGIPRPVPVGGVVDIGAYEWFIAGVSVAPNSSQTGAPGTVVTYTLQVTNTGNLLDTFLLDLPINPLGWTASVPASTGPLGPNGVATIQVLVTVPASALGGVQNTITARARSASDGTILGIATLQTTVANVANLSLIASQSATAAPGTTKVYTHTLTNSGNFTDTINFQTSATAGFPVVLSAPSLQLPAGASATVVVSVTVPSGVMGGTVNTTVVTAISSSSLGVRTATVTDVTTADQHRIVLPLAVKDAGGW